MKKIPFVKYTSYGNNFVIVDDSQTRALSESEMSNFAFEATNSCFGVGSDNLLIIQAFNKNTLNAIRKERGYWTSLPKAGGAEFIFRMFEPNGDEAFSCGNGLMCIASHLAHEYGIQSTRIMTEIPFAETRIVELGSSDISSYANMGHPRRVPMEIAAQTIREPFTDEIDKLVELSIHFRSHDLAPFTDKVELNLTGYLIFTGEPHLVIFSDEVFPEKELADTVFANATDLTADNVRGHNRANFGSWLVNRIGEYINRNCMDYFPAGLNVNFARVQRDSAVVEYRCFERGIHRETLACGTGALAVAYVARALDMIKSKRVMVLPHQCRQFQKSAQIEVQDTDSGWVLHGRPSFLFQGTFMLGASKTNRNAQQRFGSASISSLDGRPNYAAYPALAN